MFPLHVLLELTPAHYFGALWTFYDLWFIRMCWGFDNLTGIGDSSAAWCIHDRCWRRLGCLREWPQRVEVSLDPLWSRGLSTVCATCEIRSAGLAKYRITVTTCVQLCIWWFSGVTEFARVWLNFEFFVWSLDDLLLDFLHIHLFHFRLMNSHHLAHIALWNFFTFFRLLFLIYSEIVYEKLLSHEVGIMQSWLDKIGFFLTF